MELDITEDFAKQHSLTPEQVTAVKEFGTTKLAETAKTLEDKYKLEAVTNADNILDDAAKHVSEKTKVTREKGEKVADYISRASGAYLASGQSEIEKLKTEYADKLKNFDGDPATKKELETLKGEVDRLKKIEAEFEPLKGVKDQYDALVKEHGSMKVESAFGKVRPAFPETANKYEVAAKWDAFKNGVLEKYNIEIVDGEAIAIDKTNEHKRSKLSELASADPELTALMAGKQNATGSGTNPIAELVDVENVPFKVNPKADSIERTEAIKKHLLEVEKLSISSPKYAEEFAKYHALILNAKK